MTLKALVDAGTPTAMDDATATRLGLKTYTVGVGYNGGNVPDISTNTSSFTVKAGTFIPYQMQDGSWRLKFNLSLVTAAAITQAATWQFSSNIVSAQSNGASTSPYWGLGTLANSSASIIGVAMYANSSTTFFLGTFNTTTFGFSGDFPLLSKPNWAY